MSREVSFGQNRPSEGSRLAGKPHAANTLRRALRNLMTHAIDIGIRGDDPTRDVKAIRIKSGGHHSWTDLEIAQFERCHAIGSRARLALALLLYTGQRRGDVIRMGAQQVRGGILRQAGEDRPSLLSRCIRISRPLLPQRRAVI